MGTNMCLSRVTYEVHGTSSHFTVLDSASTHAHTHSRTHRLPFKGQCLCQCAGTAGLWYVSGPRPETHKDRPATGCEEGVVPEFSHSPTDPGTQDITTHTVVKEAVA